VFEKKDLAMMMVTAVIIIFVVCMLLAGLVLRVRHCYTRRQFEREQERRQRLYDDAEMMIEDGKSSSLPPPTYSEVVNAEDYSRNDNGSGDRARVYSIDRTLNANVRRQNSSDISRALCEDDATARRTLCSRQNSSDSTRALCPTNNGVSSDSNEETTVTMQQDSKSDSTTSQDSKPSTTTRTVCLSPELLESWTLCQESDSNSSQETLYTLMDQTDSATKSFDHGVLAFQSPPDYDDAVEEMEKQGMKSFNRATLSPMPPAYSELSLYV
jgi:hypothetical protein